MVGGNQSGEVFIRMAHGYWTGGGEIYIFYSQDYGQNFTVYHPFSTTVGIIPQKPTIPTTFNLTCYPNPFNPLTVASCEPRQSPGL
jgi:hypothetical protein